MSRSIAIAEVAARIGLSARTLADWRWRVRRGLPVSDAARALVALMRQQGSRWFVAEADLDRWRAAQAGAAVAPAGLELAHLQHAAAQLAAHLQTAGRDREGRLVQVAAELLGDRS